MSTEIAQLVEVCLLRERVLELTAERDALTTACDAAHQALDDLTAERDAAEQLAAAMKVDIVSMAGALNDALELIHSSRHALCRDECEQATCVIGIRLIDAALSAAAAPSAAGTEPVIFDCTRCGDPISDGYMIGDGDGMGRRFAHPECFREYPGAYKHRAAMSAAPEEPAP